MLFNLVLIFVGFVIGRWGHVYLNVWTGNVGWFPHHWIIGVLMMVVSYFIKGSWGNYIFWLGLGLFISDFNDFVHFQTFQPDAEGTKKFWGVD